MGFLDGTEFGWQTELCRRQTSRCSAAPPTQTSLASPNETLFVLTWGSAYCTLCRTLGTRLQSGRSVLEIAEMSAASLLEFTLSLPSWKMCAEKRRTGFVPLLTMASLLQASHPTLKVYRPTGMTLTQSSQTTQSIISTLPRPHTSQHQQLHLQARTRWFSRKQLFFPP